MKRNQGNELGPNLKNFQPGCNHICWEPLGQESHSKTGPPQSGLWISIPHLIVKVNI